MSNAENVQKGVYSQKAIFSFCHNDRNSGNSRLDNEKQTCCYLIKGISLDEFFSNKTKLSLSTFY